MARDFLGSGWSFPVETDHRGNIELTTDDTSIHQSIRFILGTAQGERVMRPEFGCGIHEYIFSSVDPKTLNLMEEAVYDALTRWEPRIDVEEVDAEEDPNNPGRVLIEIQYWVRNTNSRENMVYPFYVEEGEG
ncbi:baseplate protein [Halobacteriales archaeon QS_8_69_26]|nr:MAG: baseplate protein [Halobacteriales archaeon QS_8_69_26]